MHAAPLAIRIVVVCAGVTVLLGLHNPPRSWTGMVGTSLPGFTIVTPTFYNNKNFANIEVHIGGISICRAYERPSKNNLA
jgi:hypothetical protein